MSSYNKIQGYLTLNNPNRNRTGHRLCLGFIFNRLSDLKTFIIMVKFELKFKDYSFNHISIETEKSLNTETILIVLSHGKSFSQIILDKLNASKFAKTLHTKINKFTESEVSNG